jgi:hypothetical protein
MDSSGGSFVLSPVFNLKNGEWQVSILSDYSTVSPVMEAYDAGNLPTPSPSPYIQPGSQLFSSGVPTGATLQGAFPMDSTNQASTQELWSILLAYMRLVLSTIAFFLSPILQLFYGRMDDKGLDSRRVDVKESAQVYEESLLTKADREDQTERSTLSVVGKMASYQHLNADSLLVEACGGKLMVAVRPGGVVASTDHVVVDQDGRKVDPTVTRLNKEICLLEFDGETKGAFRISVA